MKTNQPLTFNQEKAYGAAAITLNPLTFNQELNRRAAAITQQRNYKRLCAIEVQASKQLELATAAMREYEKELRAEVTYSKTGETTTLQYNGRVIKLVRNSHNRLDIKENGKLIMRDMFHSVNDIRFLFALGEI